MTPSTFTRAKYADIAEAQAKLNLHWKSGGCVADKYKEAFFKLFGKGKWSWCAATQRWCAVEAGLNMPVHNPSKYGYTFAYVEAWKQWAQEMGFYHDNDGKFQPERGDAVIYDWEQTSINHPDDNHDDHIGCHLRMQNGQYVAAEGNTGASPGMTATRARKGVCIQGWIRIPDGYSFPKASE